MRSSNVTNGSARGVRTFNKWLSALVCVGLSVNVLSQALNTEFTLHESANDTYSTHARLNGNVVANQPSLTAHNRFITDTFIIELTGPSLLKRISRETAMFEASQTTKSITITSLAQQIKSEQSQVVSTLMSTGLVSQVVKQIYYSNNLLIVKMKGSAVEQLKRMPQVKAVHRDALFEPTMTTRDIRDIRADVVWEMIDNNDNNITGQGVKVAVLDTGIDYTHPHLGGCFGEGCKVAGGYDVYHDDPDPLESDDDPFYQFIGHGTHVAGIIAAKPNADSGSSNGVAPDASIYAYKVCGENLCSTVNILTGLDMAANPDGDVITDDAVDVINISLGSRFGSATDIIPATVDTLSLLGITVVVSAGNDAGFANIGGIAASREAITVASSHRDEKQLFNGDVTRAGISTFSSLGPVRGLDYLKPDIAGPGDNILSTCINSETNADANLCYKSGTSMASPHVAGVAALLKQAKPNLSSAQIKSLLINNATTLEKTDRAAQGAGRVNAQQSIMANTTFAPNMVYFGDINTSQPVWSMQKPLVITNHTDADKIFTLTFVDELPTGVNVTIVQGDSVSVMANSSVGVSVSLSVDFEQYDINSLSDFTLSQRLQVSDDNDRSYVPIIFSKMKHLDIGYTDDVPISLSIYNNQKSYLYKHEDYAFSSLYFPYGDYSGFALFKNYDEAGGYKLLAYPDVISATQKSSFIEISSQAAIHQIKINSVTLPNGELIAPAVPPRFLLDVSDSKAKFFNIIGGSNSIDLKLFDQPLFVNELPDYIELRIAGVIQQLDDTLAPRSGDYLVFNDLFKGLNQSHLYDIEMAGLAQQTFRFSPQVINDERALISPSVSVNSFVRYGYSSNLYGPFDPRRSSYTSGTSIGTAVRGADGRIAYLDKDFAMNLFVMARKEYNNQYLGLYDVKTRFQTESERQFDNVMEYAQLASNATVLWDRAQFFSDHSQRAPLLVTPAAIDFDVDFTQRITSFLPRLYISSGRAHLSSESVRVNALYGSYQYTLGGDDPNRTNQYEHFCDGRDVNENVNYIFVPGFCDSYRFTASTLNPFVDALVPNHFEFEAQHIDAPDVDKLFPTVSAMFTTQDASVVSQPNVQMARLNIAFRGAIDEVQVELKSNGAWLPLSLVDNPLAENQVSAIFPVPDKKIKHHVRVTHTSEGARSVQMFNSFMMSGRDDSVSLTEDFDADGTPDYKDQDSDNDDIDDVLDDFPLDETETLDTDKDGIGNNADEDDDEDGVADADDTFPLDPTENADTDNDGIGNNADDDDDNDGVLDTNDAFSLNSDETVDTDGDGIGNNADNDDDNDGVLDANDAFPLDATRSQRAALPASGGNTSDGGGSMPITLSLFLLVVLYLRKRKSQ